MGNSFLASCIFFFIKQKSRRLSEQQKMCNFFHKHTSMLCFLIVVDRALHYALKESFYVYLYCLYRFGDLFYELPEGNVSFLIKVYYTLIDFPDIHCVCLCYCYSFLF